MPGDAVVKVLFARSCCILLALSLTACAQSPGAESSSGPLSPEPVSSSAQWSGGLTILGGDRYAVAANGIGWILTHPTDNHVLALTKLSLIGGRVDTVVLDRNLQQISLIEGVADDGTGHLWLTYGTEIIRIDEVGGAFARWAIPPLPPEVSADQDPSAGLVYADAWDARDHSLLFVRNLDHRLYRFDPATASFATEALLPILTSDLSRISIAADGETGINGQRLGAKVFTPTAVILSARGQLQQLLPDVLAICNGPAGFMTLDRAGEAIDEVSGQLLGKVGFVPASDTPFVCDTQGNVFSSGEARLDAQHLVVVVARFSNRGAASSVNLLLRAIPVSSQFGRGTTQPSWASPELRALLPDGTGGVWLVSAAGTNDLGLGPSWYPSLWHAMYK